MKLARPVESIALVDLNAAADVAEFIEKMIPTHAPSQHAAAWQAVADALYAITNDTDAIVGEDMVTLEA